MNVEYGSGSSVSNRVSTCNFGTTTAGATVNGELKQLYISACGRLFRHNTSIIGITRLDKLISYSGVHTHLSNN